MSETEVEADETLQLYTIEDMLPCVPVEETIIFTPYEFASHTSLVYERGNDTLLVNMGDAGVGYHALAQKNDFITLPSGASAWVFDGNDDYIAIPAGPAVNNLQDMTLEWQISINGSGGNNEGRLWSKQQRPGSFDIYIDDIENRVVISRYTVYNVDEWKTPIGSVRRDIPDYIQLSWASGTEPAKASAPVFVINNEVVEVTNTLRGEGLWADDREFDAIIGNTSYGAFNLNATMSVFRSYTAANNRGVLKSNYLSDVWRMHDPAAGALAVPSDAVSSDTDPTLRIGKNLNGIDMQIDYSTVVTKLYPRGSGTFPSELRLDNPTYWPGASKLELVSTDSTWTYFKIPGDYTVYSGFTAPETPLPYGYFVGRGVNSFVVGQSVPDSTEAIVASQGQAVAYVFIAPHRFHLLKVGFYLKHEIIAPITRQSVPRFIVGLYNCIDSGGTGTIPSVQPKGYHIPNHGPIEWCIVNLYSIRSDKFAWYYFPMQGMAHAGGDSDPQWSRWAIVVSPYPSTDKWNPSPINATDYLSFGKAPNHATDQGAYRFCNNGINYKNWVIPDAVGMATNQIAFAKYTAAVNVTDQFVQSWAATPGRMVKTHTSNYQPSQPYYFHYRLASYLINWDAYQKYGKIEGTYKNDALTTQEALLKAGSEYLKTISQPVVTFSVSVADLYNLDPQVNWAEELHLGTEVTVVDAIMGIEQKCIVTKLTKPNLNQPHDIQIQLDNIHPNVPRLLAQLSASQLAAPKYLQGQTVSTPYTAITQADHNTPAYLKFKVRDVTTLAHEIRLVVTGAAYQQAGTSGVTNSSDQPTAFYVSVDGNPVT